MRKNIFKPDLEAVKEMIIAHGEINRKNPNYLVMSTETLEIVEYYSGFNLTKHSHDGTKSYSSSIYGVKIAINNTLELGEVDLV